jgi:uncharacterized protein
MTLIQFGLLFLAAIAAGAMNAVAGGGSFFTFPALLFVGVPSIEANATNTIALWPGVLAGIGAYRHELAHLRDKLLPMAVVSLIGGGMGALLLLNINESTFEKMIPFLLLLATAIFASSPRVNQWMRSRKGPTLADRQWLVLLMLFAIAVYGGFFGGGIGIMMLALLAISGFEDISQMNALKLVLNAMINGVAVVLFVIAGKVVWAAGLVMIAGAILGGYFGALLAQRVQQIWVRRFVVAVGSFLTIYFFYKYWLQ